MDGLRGLTVAARSLWNPDVLPGINIQGLGSCIPIRSARAAIVLSLKVLALPPGASIGVPLYCCPVVFKAIKAAGCNPHFIDVDPTTYCMSATDLAAKSSHVDAVIAVHMFGNTCDMHALREAAPGKPFIEDCAQALGSQFDGRLAGSFGEISVFSFRLGKYLSVGEGGAIYCGAPDRYAQLLRFVTELSIPSRLDECRHVATTYLRSALRSRPLWGLLGTQLWNTYNKKVHYRSQSPLALSQIYRTDHDMTARRLPYLASWIEKQRSNADYYSMNLSVDADILCSETPQAFYNRFQYPLLIPNSNQCDRLAAYLLENQITTTRPYKDIANIAKIHYGYNGDCPQAERVAETVLVIPCNHKLKSVDVERIVKCVNKSWGRVCGH